MDVVIENLNGKPQLRFSLTVNEKLASGRTSKVKLMKKNANNSTPAPKASGQIRPRSPATQQQQQQKQVQPRPANSAAAAASTTNGNKNANQKQQPKQQQQQPAKAKAAQQQPTQQNQAATHHDWSLVLVGTYHSAIQGYTFRFSRDEMISLLKTATTKAEAAEPLKDYQLAPWHTKPPQIRFSGTPHVGCVYSVACNGSNLVASAGHDERIALCTIKNNGTAATELGTMQPAATVRCLSFVSSGGGHMLCGCDDGSLAVYRTRSWECQAVLPIHEKALISFVTTPNGAVAVALGADRYVAVVDLMRGEVIFRHKFAPAIATAKMENSKKAKVKKAENDEQEKEEENQTAAQRFGFVHQPPRQVLLSPSGDLVAVVAPFYVTFLDLRNAKIICTVDVADPQPQHELQSGCFVKTSSSSSSSPRYHVVLSTESGEIVAISVPSPSSGEYEETNKNSFQWASSVDQVPFATTTTAINAEIAAGTSSSTTNVPSSRIRSVTSVGESCDGVATASSSGELRMWIALSASSNNNSGSATVKLIECCAPVQVGGRVTCVAASKV